MIAVAHSMAHSQCRVSQFSPLSLLRHALALAVASADAGATGCSADEPAKLASYRHTLRQLRARGRCGDGVREEWQAEAEVVGHGDGGPRRVEDDHGVLVPDRPGADDAGDAAQR